MEYKDYLINKLEQTSIELDLFNKNKTYVVGILSIVMTITSQMLGDEASIVLIAITLLYLILSLQIGMPLAFVDSKKLYEDENSLLKHVDEILKEVEKAHETFEDYTTLYVMFALLIILINYLLTYQ